MNTLLHAIVSLLLIILYCFGALYVILNSQEHAQMFNFVIYASITIPTVYPVTVFLSYLINKKIDK
jgi:hypothetical protein